MEFVAEAQNSLLTTLTTQSKVVVLKVILQNKFITKLSFEAMTFPGAMARECHECKGKECHESRTTTSQMRRRRPGVQRAPRQRRVVDVRGVACHGHCRGIDSLT